MFYPVRFRQQQRLLAVDARLAGELRRLGRERQGAAAVAVSGKYVYVLGGMGDANALSSVELATASRNGQLGYLAKQ